jgi:hypothetical protein
VKVTFLVRVDENVVITIIAGNCGAIGDIVI